MTYYIMLEALKEIIRLKGNPDLIKRLKAHIRAIEPNSATVNWNLGLKEAMTNLPEKMYDPGKKAHL